MPRPQKSHDLRLPAWGPYSKRYAGISHIPDVERGLRFDLGIMPGHYRRQMLIPNEKWASGHHPWEAAPDLRYYTYRYEIEWQDRVFCDVSFAADGEQARLLRCRFVNNSDLAQSLMLHLVGYMNFPPVRPYSDEPLLPGTVSLPERGIWVDALDYADLQFATPRPTDGLVADGLLRAEVREHGLVNGSGIGDGFGGEAGDWVSWRLPIERPLAQAALILRYRPVGNEPARFRLEGVAAGEILLPGADVDEQGCARLTIPLGPLPAGAQALRLVSLGGGAVVVDGLALTEAEQAAAINFGVHTWTHAPRILPGPAANSLILKYADSDVFFGLAWDHPDFWVRQLLNDELDTLLRFLVPNNYSEVVDGPGEGHFTDVFLRPISLAARSESTLYGLICAGDEAEVGAALEAFLGQDDRERERLWASNREAAMGKDCLPAGEPFLFSQARMAATELVNVVYPVYTRRQYIRHNTPGKWWDCLYTWDSGFIGLALLELDRQRAWDCLSAYLTEPGDAHAAFVHHGTPLPTQIYLFHELWNRTQDPAVLETFYPGLRQYYLFLAGHLNGSTTRRLQSSLLVTWEYFFESGGWDDYPAQMHVLRDYLDSGNMQESGIRINTACAAVTAHVIRMARILHAAAAALELPDDRALYEADVARFSTDLQQLAWDDEAGYFSYVVHDEEGRPTGHLRDESGLNFNMGLDGVMPLIAGICTPAQEASLLQKLQDPDHFWTPLGLSTVDQAAPYYRKDGYWNGAVWFPHQWFIWKTALDLGQADFAYQIARTALDLWKREVEASYYCFEHFIIETGRGAGWHQFGGLSSPVVSWFHAYYTPGRLTTGFDVWVDALTVADDKSGLTATLRQSGTPRTAVLLVTLRPGTAYRATWNGSPVAVRERHPGCLEIEVPFATARQGQLVVA